MADFLFIEIKKKIWFCACVHHVGQSKAFDRLRFTKVSLFWIQLVYLLCVCVCVCVCVCARTWAENRSDSKLRFSAHPPTHYASKDSSLSPLSTLTSTFFSSNIHITLFLSLCTFFTLIPPLFAIMSQSVPFLSFPLLFLFLFLPCSSISASSSSSSRNLRQPSSITQWTGKRYTSSPCPDLFLILFVTPLSSSSSPALWSFFLSCICVSTPWCWFTNVCMCVCVCVLPEIKFFTSITLHSADNMG